MNAVKRVEVMNLQDHPDQLELTAKFLEDLGTRVVSVEQGQLCLSEAQRYRFAAQHPYDPPNGLRPRIRPRRRTIRLKPLEDKQPAE